MIPIQCLHDRVNINLLIINLSHVMPYPGSFDWIEQVHAHISITTLIESDRSRFSFYWLLHKQKTRFTHFLGLCIVRVFWLFDYTSLKHFHNAKAWLLPHMLQTHYWCYLIKLIHTSVYHNFFSRFFKAVWLHVPTVYTPHKGNWSLFSIYKP